MILTSRYVVLNNPKTGSTFTRKMLQQLAGHPFERQHWGHWEPGKRETVKRWYTRFAVRTGLADPVEVFLPRLWKPERPIDQHGGVWQIPWEFRNLPVVMNVRNPLDRKVSRYHFRWYAKHPAAPVNAIREQFPGFPDLAFEEYLSYCRTFKSARRFALKEAKTPDVGFETLHFIRMFFRQPNHVVRHLDDAFVESGAFMEYIPERFHLLRTENLNADLADGLLKLGYADKQVAFIREEEKIQPKEGTQREETDTWRSHYTPELYDEVVQEERLLISMLKQLGVEYAL
jgi:hypothetical protein